MTQFCQKLPLTPISYPATLKETVKKNLTARLIKKVRIGLFQGSQTITGCEGIFYHFIPAAKMLTDILRIVNRFLAFFQYAIY
jgi:hypothetical protein